MEVLLIEPKVPYLFLLTGSQDSSPDAGTRRGDSFEADLIQLSYPIALMAAGFAFDASIYRDSSSAQAFDADEARAKWETARAERVMEEWRSYLEHSSLEPFKSMSVSSFSL